MRLILKEWTSLRTYHSEALVSRSTRRGVVDLVPVIACETGSREPIAPNCTRAIFYAGKTYKTLIWICDVILTAFSPVKRDLYVEEEDCSE